MPRVWSREPDSANLETILELGEGGMGKAYLARAVGAGGFQRLVVIKRLNLQLLAVPEAVERFLAEARVAARIHHANVIGTQQIGRDAAGPFIVLDYIEGGTFDDLLAMRPLPIPVILRIALDALYGLRAVHEARDVDGRALAILHRDISLQNVLISAVDGMARLSDFGVAKSALGNVRTEDGVFVGKLRYFSPEYLDREPVGPPLDIYALGVTLWLALTRQELWEEADDAQVIRAILDEGIPPLRPHVDVAPQIEELVARACDRDPGRRYQSAREMAAVLERFDREHGWLASHAEVGALVEEVLAPDLVYRRRRISRVVQGELGTAPTESGVVPPPPSPPRSEARQRLASRRPVLPVERKRAPAKLPDVRTPKSGPRLRSLRSAGPAVLGIAAVASGAMLVASKLRDPPAPRQTAPVEITRGAAPESTQQSWAASRPAAAAPTVEQRPDGPPSEPVTKASARMPTASVAPGTRAGPVERPDATAGETTPPTSLRKQNPYRRAPVASANRSLPAPSSSASGHVDR